MYGKIDRRVGIAAALAAAGVRMPSPGERRFSRLCLRPDRIDGAPAAL
jgi:hypothetical protein